MRCIEEVQRRPAGRGVDDDQVELAGARPADRASPWPCTPGCRRTTSRWSCRTDWRRSARRGPGWSCAATISSKVRLVSSIIAHSSLAPGRARRSPDAVSLSSSPSPSDWASRRAGSMVSTATLRPASAAYSAIAAAVVVLPTPPEPQVTTTLVYGSCEHRLRSSGDRCAHPADSLVGQQVGQFVHAAQVGTPSTSRGSGQHRHAGRGQLVATASRSASTRIACSAVSVASPVEQLRLRPRCRPIARPDRQHRPVDLDVGRRSERSREPAGTRSPR